MEYNFETLNCCYDREVYKHVIKTQSIELAEFVIKKWNDSYMLLFVLQTGNPALIEIALKLKHKWNSDPFEESLESLQLVKQYGVRLDITFLSKKIKLECLKFICEELKLKPKINFNDIESDIIFYYCISQSETSLMTIATEKGFINSIDKLLSMGEIMTVECQLNLIRHCNIDWLNKYNIDYHNLLDQLTLPEESDWDWYGIDLLKAIKTYRMCPKFKHVDFINALMKTASMEEMEELVKLGYVINEKWMEYYSDNIGDLGSNTVEGIIEGLTKMIKFAIKHKIKLTAEIIQELDITITIEKFNAIEPIYNDYKKVKWQ